MGYEPKALQNVSGYSGEEPTIRIDEGSPEWDTAFTRWLDMKNPTDSPEWKKGVFLLFGRDVRS